MTKRPRCFPATRDSPQYLLDCLLPLIKIANPKSGRYEIWVGSFKENELPKAVLKITELK